MAVLSLLGMKASRKISEFPIDWDCFHCWFTSRLGMLSNSDGVPIAVNTKAAHDTEVQFKAAALKVEGLEHKSCEE